MSSESRPLVNDRAVVSAAWTPSKLAVGLENGVVRVYSRRDLVSEREIRIGRGSVVQIAAIPDSEIVAFICDKRCTVHDLAIRRIIEEVDSRSAKYVICSKDTIVVGSGYKLRILHFKNGIFNSIAVVDTVDRTKVRALGLFQPAGSSLSEESRDPSSHRGDAENAEIYAIIGTKSPKLWRVDLAGSGRLIPVMMLDPQKFGKAHKFFIAGTADASMIVSSVASSFSKSSDHVKIEKESPPFEGVSLVQSQPAPVTSSAVLTELSEKTIKIFNPVTGSALFGVKTKSNGASTGSGFYVSGESHEIVPESSVDSLLSSQFDRAEAAKSSFAFPSSQVTESIRDSQRDEVSELFRKGEVDEAMRLLLIIEEQEPESGLFVNNAFATELSSPFLEEMPADGGHHGATENTNINNHSGGASVRTGRTAMSARTNATSYAAAVRYHPLNSTVAYLTYTRRKLRLKGAANSEQTEQLSKIDTASFLCFYIMHSRLLGSLSRSPNQCDPQIVESRSSEGNQWRLLVDFFKSRHSVEYHEKALDLLVDHHESSTAIINYSCRVPDLNVVFRYAQPILQKQPELAEDSFHDNLAWKNTTGVSPKIYKFLHDDVSSDKAKEFALFEVIKRNNASPYSHTMVALILAGKAQALIDEGNGEKPEASAALTDLLHFLETSKHSNSSQLVNNDLIPVEGRAILEKRLGHYEKAIDLYLETGNQRAAQNVAESYNRVTFMFDKLLKTKNKEKLTEFSNSVNISSDLQMNYVVSKLSTGLHISEISDFLVNLTSFYVRKTYATNSLDAVSRRALAEENIQIANQKRNHITITSLDACVICHKRLGRTLTCVLNDQIMHYTCYKNRRH